MSSNMPASKALHVLINIYINLVDYDFKNLGPSPVYCSETWLIITSHMTLYYLNHILWFVVASFIGHIERLYYL